jgi:hypothetical protein
MRQIQVWHCEYIIDSLTIKQVPRPRSPPRSQRCWRGTPHWSQNTKDAWFLHSKDLRITCAQPKASCFRLLGPNIGHGIILNGMRLRLGVGISTTVD